MNRYIKAMEIGLANENKGTDYFKILKAIISPKDDRLSIDAELSFFGWFIDNFNNPNNIFKVEQYDIIRELYRDWLYINDEEGTYQNFELIHDDLRFILDGSWFINGNTAKQYLDYLELQESRIASTQARIQSSISIWIAIGAILISTFLGAYTIYSSPKTPYDVKVIENKTGNDKLQEENKELKEKLFKAELMIRVLEEE